jgi:hypothetical protein
MLPGGFGFKGLAPPKGESLKGVHGRERTRDFASRWIFWTRRHAQWVISPTAAPSISQNIHSNRHLG